MMLNQKSRPLRVLYAAGPGNVLGTYQYWRQNQDDPSQISVTYSGQFFDTCHALGAKGYIISSCHEKAMYQDDQFKIEHRPNPFAKASGIIYHLGQILYGLRLIISAIRWQTDVAVVADGTTHWFVLSLLNILGIKVIPSLHCVIWFKYLPRRKSEQFITRLNRRLFSKSASVLAVSKDIADQVKQIVGSNTKPPVREFIPFYRREAFSSITPPHFGQTPFRVLFIGRMEPEKGVLDLLEIAKQFKVEGRKDICFGFCGNGSALATMKQEISKAELEASVELYGNCNRSQLQEKLSQSHVVIVPTKTTFVEGFCKVIAEGILAGRPVITSTVCPALPYVYPGIVEVAPDDVAGYKHAILQLCDDPDFYRAKQQGGIGVQEQFYNGVNSWGNALKQALIAIQQPKLEPIVPAPERVLTLTKSAERR